MTKTITESEMKFVADNSFYIEKSPLYTNLGDSVRSVEFVRAKGKNLLFIEAKSSFPKPDNADTTKAKRFIEEISIICDKFTHSLNLYSAAKVGVIDGKFPDDFKPSNKVSLVFVLVINRFERTWCDPIEKALTLRLSESTCIAKIWKPSVLVMDDKTAASRKLIVN